MKSLGKGIAVLALAIMGTGCMASQNSLKTDMAEIATLQEAGSLQLADERTRELLQRDGLSAEERRSLEYELERSRRIRMDYRVTRERLWEIVSEGVEGVTKEEFEGWLAEGRFDRKVVDGEERFVGPSLANLFFRHHELAPRRVRKPSSRWDQFLVRHARTTIEETSRTNTDTASPQHFRINFRNTVKAGQVPEGETIRCWMVYPQQFASQSAVVLESVSPEPVWINGPAYPARSIYFEQPSKGNAPTTFEATYTVTTQARRVAIDPDRVAAADQAGAETAWFLREQPHVEFTPELRALAASITGSETNPAIKARLIYDWVGANIDYSYAREYSTLRNISMYCYQNGYGDCGQITLLYMTLCRIAGVPARWQSGWVIYPEDQNLHDWCEIWLAPYGWVPVDPNYGVFFSSPRSAGLPDSDRAMLRDFYFGGLDAYRLVVNRDHAFPHYPAKSDFRSDNVDFQRGELEAGGRNLYFDQFGYNLELEILEEQGGEPEAEGERQARAEIGPGTPGRER